MQKGGGERALTRFMRMLIIAVVSLIGWSCAVTRHIPEGEYLLQSITIENDKSAPKEERISPYTFERYVRQSPNRRLFGSNFYIWMWNQANPDKDNWWNNFKRSVGQEPVYYQHDLAVKSEENLKVYMDALGYYSSTASFVVDTLTKERRARVTYFTHQGEPYKIADMKYKFQDTLLRSIILADTVNSLIHTGNIFSVSLLDEERERITNKLRNNGYFDFTVRNIEYLADTLAGDKSAKLEMIIKQALNGYDSRGNAIYENSLRYRVGSVNIVPNFDPSLLVNDSTFMSEVDTIQYKGINIIVEKDKESNVRPNVLRQMVPLNKGMLFDASTVEQTYQNLMSLGYFKSARISFRPTTLDSLNTDSTLIRRLERRDKKSLTDSITKPADSFIASYILCTPALKQSYDIEIEASTTSSFYGVYATVGYQNRNIFKGAESWDIDFTAGYEYMKARDAVKKRATEIGITTGLTFPRFLLPLSTGPFTRVVKPQTTTEFSVNWQDRPYYNRTLTSASLSYGWKNRGSSSFIVRPIDINVINMNYIDEDYFDDLENDYLKNSYETQLIAGLSLGYVYNNQLANVGGNSTLLHINVETSGNSINAIKGLFNSTMDEDGYYNIFGIRYAQYVRSDINVSRKLSLGGSCAVAGRIYAGAALAYGNSTSIPFDRLFYSGGSNSMRGWTPRTLGPGDSLEPEDTVYSSQLGDMKLEANLEFRFPVWDNFHGATFFDLGNIWYLKDSEGVYDSSALFDKDTFYKQLGFNTGVGIRLDIQFAVLRLDWGIQLHNPNKVEGERWVIKNFDLSNTSLNFGVGYPF